MLSDDNNELPQGFKIGIKIDQQRLMMMKKESELTEVVKM